jgi:hypothetical protein
MCPHTEECVAQVVALASRGQANDEPGKPTDGEANREPVPPAGRSRTAHAARPRYWMTRTRCASAHRSSRR